MSKTNSSPEAHLPKLSLDQKSIIGFYSTQQWPNSIHHTVPFSGPGHRSLPMTIGILIQEKCRNPTSAMSNSKVHSHDLSKDPRTGLTNPIRSKNEKMASGLHASSPKTHTAHKDVNASVKSCSNLPCVSLAHRPLQKELTEEEEALRQAIRRIRTATSWRCLLCWFSPS